MRTFFMQQMIELQTNYMQMFVMLRMKHAQLQSVEESLATVEQKPDATCQSATEAIGATGETTLFWEHQIPQFSDEEFLDSLHVSRSTFRSLCSQLAPTLRLAPELTCAVPHPISADKCVGLALYFLASGERISIISDQFALPRTRTIKCLKIFCNAVMSSLGKALRMLPQSVADCDNVVAGFQRECNMPAALVGMLGVCCIPLRGKAKHYAEDGPSLRMEFLLDDRMLFRELQLGNNHGRVPLSPLFSETPNPLALLPPRSINKRKVPAFVLAPVNQNYPLRPWLLQRYADPVAPHEYDFNEVADHLQELSDCALHRLMSRWRFLSQPLDISFQTAACIITAATVLHNLLEELSEPHMLEWGNTVDVSRFRSPPIVPKPDNSEDAEHALKVRDFLARTISSTEM
ncbi:GH14797 [Drosophila grimshawi]|uniref:GH14797 n=2 Tax=Drosophila grimshawi TaxID=7222 RepID=B4J3C5_DROGR|nr:GH14797 [Drosophila grimshawi]